MKLTRAAVVAVACVLLAATGLIAQEAKWFDMQNCEFCKLMTAKPALTQSTKWETVKLSNGIATVETVPPQSMADYHVVCDSALALGKKLEKGEKLQLCGFCSTLGDLMKRGIHHEFVYTSTGGITFLTSDKPELQKEILAYNDKAQEMMKQIMPPPADTSGQKTK